VAIPEERSKAASRVRDAMKHHEVIAAGILSGVAGGITMMAVLVLAAAAQGIAPLHPLMVVGETFIGPEALDAVAAKVAFGAFVHVLTSAAFGVVFAGIVPRDFRMGCAMGLGAGTALFAMGFMMSTIVPWANPGFRAASQVIGGSWVLAHAVFGVTLGIAPPLRRWISRAASHTAVEGQFLRTPAAPVAPTTRTT
jgi:hypothetical protein